MIISDKKGVEQSLEENLMLTYYITILILLGFFVFSKFIFYILFFLFFCPCATYALVIEINEEYQINLRKKVL
jgi:hypothetical protein